MIDVTSAEFTSPDKPHNAEWIVEIESATFDQPAANQHVDKLAVYFRDQAKVDLPVVYPLGVVAGFLEDKEFGLLIRDEAEGKS